MTCPFDREGRSATRDAADYILDMLAEGSVPASEAKSRVSGAIGCSERTVDAAKALLRSQGIDVVVKEKGFQSRWRWELPEGHTSQRTQPRTGWTDPSTNGAADDQEELPS